MQLFGESTSGISVKLNAAALAEHSEPIADATLRSVQEFRDRSQLLVSSKIEQSPVIIFGPRTTITLRTPLCGLPKESEFCRPPPNHMRAPVRVSFQQLAYRVSLFPPSIFVPLAQDLFIFYTPYRTSI